MDSDGKEFPNANFASGSNLVNFDKQISSTYEFQTFWFSSDFLYGKK